MRTTLILGLVGLLVAGCASKLNVQVDVMNPAYAQAAVTEASFLVDLNSLAQGRHTQAETLLSDGVAQLRAFRRQCFATMIADQEARAATQSGPALTNTQGNLAVLQRQRGNESEIDAFESLWRSRLYKADVDARAALGSDLAGFVGLSGYGTTKRAAKAWAAPLPDDVKQELATRSIVFDSFVTDTRRMIDERRDECTQAANAPSSTAIAKSQAAGEQAKQNVEAAKLTSVVGGGRLLNELTEAFFVTRAPASAWAPHYNRAVAEGQMGNMSVAVKMNDTADFSIKGMVFDGRATAQLMSKIGTQTVAVIARAYGAPISIGSAGESSTKQVQFDTSKTSSAQRESIARAEAEDKAYRSSLFQIADAVLANFQGLETDRDAAKEIVDAVIDVNTAQWKKTEPE